MSRMMLTVNLSSDLERRLLAEAERRGLSTDQFTVELLAKYLPSGEESPQVIALLQSWIDEDNATEQQQTGDYLIKVLDDDRLSDRKLFPPDLQGVTW